MKYEKKCFISKVHEMSKSLNKFNCDLEKKIANWDINGKYNLTPIPINKQIKFSSLENYTETVSPVHLLNSIKIILLNVVIRNL